MLSEFPKIQHLPWAPNLQHDDHIAELADVEHLLEEENLIIQEKVDGANCAVIWNNGTPIVRGRTRMITKGRVKDTPANAQFRPIWNWIYNHKEQFECLNSLAGGPVGVYGDWMLAQHGLEYNRLPSYFLAYEIFIPEKRIWKVDNTLLERAGFVVSPILHSGSILTQNRLIDLCEQTSVFSTNQQREGIVVKVLQNNNVVEKRYKMIRKTFVQGSLWNEQHIVKQKLYNGG